ncbi:MAG: RIP metalloprotease [Aeromicrobium sp.]|nr:MAG: RIP metalloprotease [Aeromicrobium sp.]
MNSTVLYTIGVVAFVLGIAASIALHEVGHMWPAKKFGMKVTKFFVGFGTTIWSAKKGETEYGVKAIPLGGFVKIVGMLPPDAAHAAANADGHIQVRDTNTGLFTQWASEARDAEYEDVEPEDYDRLFYRKPWWQKVIVMAGGPTVNLVIATVLFTISFSGFGVNMPTLTVAEISDCAISDREAPRACTGDDPVTPAVKAGLQPGDTFVSFNGKATEDWDDVIEMIRANGDRAATIVFKRDGRNHEVKVNTSVLARMSLDDPEQTERVGFLGVTPEFEVSRQGPVFIAQEMWALTVRSAEAIVKLPVRMVDIGKAAFGGERQADGPIGVVGASRVAGELVTYDEPSLALGTQRIIGLLASLNLFLWLFNLVPLLPLDGGHIIGALWEGIRRGWARLRGKPDPGHVDVAKALPVAYAVGLVLMIMGVLLVYVDIVNPVRLT